jgi:hypothetical protein
MISRRDSFSHDQPADRRQEFLNHSDTSSDGTIYRAAQPQLNALSGAIPSAIGVRSWFDRKEVMASWYA